MKALGLGLMQTLQKGLARDLDQAVTAQARQRVLEHLIQGFMQVRKLEDAQTAARCAEMCKRFEVLAETFELRVVGGRLVVKASGDAEVTMRLLERGTTWFDPAGDVTGLIAGAVLN